mgnify:CR=1 FL=1
MQKYNSTIKIKPCKCGCGKPKTMSLSGYHSIKCLPEDMQKLERFKKSNVTKANATYRSNLTRKVHSIQNDKNGQESPEIKSKVELALWFNDRMDRLEAKCECCGATAKHLKRPEFKRLWKSCQSHLLPKRHFKSLQTHPLNGMVLGSGLSGMCHCHDDFDSSWQKAATMKIFDEVVRRFLIMYPLIQPNEHQFIPNQLIQELPNNQI